MGSRSSIPVGIIGEKQGEGEGDWFYSVEPVND